MQLEAHATIHSHHAQKKVLRAVATVEWLKGIIAVLIGIVAIQLIHRDTWEIAEKLLAFLHINTDHRTAQMFLDFADNLTGARLRTAAELSFVYSGLRFIEGYGLWNQRTWAEWLAFGSGMLLMPLEIKAIARHANPLHVGALIVNIGIVLYMFYLLRIGQIERKRLRALAAGVPENIRR